MDTEVSKQIQDTEDLAATVQSDAPRVTLDDILNKIGKKKFIRVDDDLEVGGDGITTLCIARLQNGFFVFGQATPASPERFDASIGERNAFSHVVSQVWLLEGYLLRQRLWEERNSGIAIPVQTAPGIEDEPV
jgi:hypothetical protein